MEVAILFAWIVALCIGTLLAIYALYKIILYFNNIKSFFTTPHAIVLLNGKKKAGKTTIIELLNRGAFVPSYQPTQQPSIKKAATITTQNGRRYAFWDTSGLYHIKDSSNLHDSLEILHKKNHYEILSVYVFNIAEYEECKNEIIAHTQICKDKGYIALALATRGDKLNSTERRNLNAEMSRIFGIPIKVFDLTVAPVEEMINFIESSETNAARLKRA
ncbi:MAG: hypothetical protein K2N12_06415 [Helicobacter sp.]|nr:hypothetical protein [Helicobacter sp.]